MSVRQGDSVEVGTVVRFYRRDLGHEGEEVRDTVRGFFWQQSGTGWYLAVTLTNYSWVFADRILPDRDQ